MKNQQDLIVAAVALVLMIGFSLTFMLNKHAAVTTVDPEKIPLGDVALPGGSVVMSNSLGGANNQQGGGGGGRSGIPAFSGLPPTGPGNGGLPPSGPPRGK